MRAAIFILSVLSLPATVVAQTQRLPALALDRLSLDATATASLAVGSGELLVPGQFRASVAAGYEKNPLVLFQDGQRAGAVVGDRFGVHLMAAFGVASFFEVGADVPLLPYQAGDSLSSTGFDKPTSFGLGAPLLRGRVSLLESRFLDVAAEVGVRLPIGSRSALGSGDGLEFVPRLMASRRFGHWWTAAEVSSLLRSTETIGVDRIGSELGIAASIGREITDRFRLELMGRGTLPTTGLPISGEVMAGARYAVGGPVEIFAMAGPGIRPLPGTPAFRTVMGLSFSLFGARGPIAMEPAPPAAPIAALVRTAWVPPAPPRPLVVAEFVEKPCEAGLAHLPEQCPDLDDDGDGIPNKLDQCPLEPGIADTHGCPVKDSDGDGVPDHLDNCPSQRGPATNHGCPMEIKQIVAITVKKIELKDKVYFDTGKASIQRRSFRMLDQVASVVRSHPTLPIIHVEGHTDSQGGEAKNRKLSRIRAEAVRAYLLKKGIAPQRLAAMGFGPDRPIAPNATNTGRAQNRRVEFVIGEEEQ